MEYFPFSKDHFHNLCETFSESQMGHSKMIVARSFSAVFKNVFLIFRTLTFAEQESLATTLMGCYNTAHSIVLRCSVLHALTGLARGFRTCVSDTHEAMLPR